MIFLNMNQVGKAFTTPLLHMGLLFVTRNRMLLSTLLTSQLVRGGGSTFGPDTVQLARKFCKYSSYLKIYIARRGEARVPNARS